jgi:N-acetylglutamate synthase/N-acetylornithine aminotransferase
MQHASCAAELAKHLDARPEEIFVSSTGRHWTAAARRQDCCRAIPDLDESNESAKSHTFFRAIQLTSDTVPKVAEASGWRCPQCWGFAKGSA